MFQQKVNNVLLTDPATIDPQQVIRGQDKFFVVIRDRLQRRKFPIRIFRRKNIADLDIETVVSPVYTKSTSATSCFPMLTENPRAAAPGIQCSPERRQYHCPGSHQRRGADLNRRDSIFPASPVSA